MKIGIKKKRLVPAAMLLILAVIAAGAAWAGIRDGKLNSDRKKVDLSVNTAYPESDAKNQITLGSSTVNLVDDLTLGSKAAVDSYAATHIDPAMNGAAGGAILVGSGQILNIMPESGKKVYGAAGSSLRLFGAGTTNLYEGASNSYPHTFIQSGTLNIESKAALGGSDLTVGGGTAIGLIEEKSGHLDLSGVSIELRRYDGAQTENTSSTVTFDTGSKETNSVILPELREITNAGGGTNSITILKQGKGRLVMGGVSNHTGGTIAAEGTLELRSVPQSSQTIEVRGGATLKSTASSLSSIRFKPHPGAILSIPALSTEAKTSIADTGTAVLAFDAMDGTLLTGTTGQLKIDADLSGVTLPATEADVYYVKLLSSPSPHGIAASSVSIEGTPPQTGSSYAMRPFVDANSVYAALSKDIQITESISLGVSRTSDSATITARLSDGADGKSVSFTLKDSSGNTVDSAAKTSQNGSVQAVFSGLLNATYTVYASSAGYNGATRSFTIDGTSSNENVFDVVVYDVYDETTSKKLIAVRLDNSPNPFQDGASFKYRFIAAGGTPAGGETNAVTDLTLFSAQNVSYSNDRTRARFDIDPSNLTADNGNKYVLAKGVTYHLWVENTGAGDRSDGTSSLLIDSDGQYVSPSSLLLATYVRASGTDTIAAWAIATKGGTAQPHVSVTFTLLDTFGNPVNISGVPNTITQSTDASGRADVLFTPLPHGDYIVKAYASGSNVTGYSKDLKLGTSGGGGSGGCNAGLGILALALALAAIKRGRH